MNISELKLKAKEKLNTIEKERISNAEDFELEEIGTIKLAAPLPRAAYNLLLEVLPYMQNNEEEGGIKMYGNEKYVKMLVKECTVEPLLDDEAIDLIFDAIDTTKRFELISKCITISQETASEMESVVDNAENFTEETPGPSNEQE